MKLLFILLAAAAFDSGEIQSITVMDAMHSDRMLGVCAALTADPKGTGDQYIVATKINCATLYVPERTNSLYFRVLTDTQVFECWGVEAHEGALIVPIMGCE